MREEIKQLEALEGNVQSTWALLDIDRLIVEGRGLDVEMQDTDFWKDAENAKKVSKRRGEIVNEVEIWTKLKTEVGELLELSREMEKEPDLPAAATQQALQTGSTMREDVKKRIAELEKQFQDLEFYLLFSEKYDKKNAIVAFHAGSGGTEAQDWAEMLRRMIVRYAEKKGWYVTVLDESRGAEAGLKSSVIRIEGRYAYGNLKSEHGTHRLVRISPFDAEKMRHTSFALIEVIPELETEEGGEIDPKDLRIDTFMSGGHGGQSVNTTYSAVRIVHIPTGITVQCQNERSQMQNKDVAMRVLKSKLQKLQEEKEEAERQKIRGEYKSAEWGNQIRSYVLHPYKMVKDVRTKFESKDPEAVLNGELDPFVEAYLRWLKSAPRE